MLVRRKSLLWLLPLLFLLLLSAATYFYFPQIAQRSLHHWLSEQGFENIILEMERPGWNRIYITQLNLSRQAEGKLVNIHSGRISLEYDPYQLFSEQRIKLLQLPESKISIRYLQEESGSEQERVDLTPLLPAIWLPTLPADLIRIGEMTLALDYPEGTPDWTFIGALQSDNQRLTSRIRMVREQHSLGWADLEMSADNHFHFRLLQADTPFLVVDGELSFDQQLTLQSTQLINLSGLHNWLNLMLPQPLPAAINQGSFTFSGTSQFPLTSYLSPRALLNALRTQQKFTGSAQVESPLPEINTLGLTLDGELSYDGETLNTEFSPTSAITLKQVSADGLDKPIETLALNIRSPMLLGLSKEQLLQQNFSEPQLQLSEITAQLSPLLFNDHRLELSPFTIRLKQFNLSNQSAHISVKQPGIRLTHPQQNYPPLSFAGTFQLTNNLLQSALELSSSTTPINLSVKGSTRFPSGNSQLSWQAKPVSLRNIDQTLARYIDLPAQLTIDRGTLFHRGSARFRNGALNGRLYNSVRNADLLWDKTPLRGIDWDSSSTLSRSGKLQDKGAIKVRSVKQGVEISNLSTQYAFQTEGKTETLSLSETHLELLEGKIALTPLQFSLQAPRFNTQVSVDKMDLGALLSLEQQQGLSGEGKLSGSFPLNYHEGIITVSDGLLQAEPPGGVIRFQPNASVMAYAASNAGLKMALGALENFRFTTLSAGLDYSEDGTAYLQTRLAGSNPEWQQGQLMNFNINVEENIPALLKTLQFADKLTETIEKRYR